MPGSFRHVLELVLGTALTRRSQLFATFALIIAASCAVLWLNRYRAPLNSTNAQISSEMQRMTTTSTIDADIDAFVSVQNQTRGKTFKNGAVLALDYNASTGTVPAGGNAVAGIAGIAAGAATIALPASQAGNAVIIDGAVSTKASTSGIDSYSLIVDTTGTVTMTDNNTGNSQTITGASYLVFDGGAATSAGAYQSAYLVESGVAAQMASMYNAAYGRLPDFAGLEFYIDQYGSPDLPDLHTMANYFLFSPEFKTHWPTLQTTADNGGLNDQAYINALYGQILHRTPTALEVQFYVNALQGTLTDSSGQPIAAADRAQLLVYFSLSPENQSDISATNGGWLINSGKGAVSLGAMSTSAANAVLASQVASGTVSADAFVNMSSSGQTTVQTSNGSVTITGADHGAGAAQQADPEIATSIPNETVNLSSTYFMGALDGSNETLNGVPTGGSIALLPSNYPTNYTGTVNLFGNVNWLSLGNTLSAVTAYSIINGWNSTDLIVGPNGAAPSFAYSAATLLANPDGLVLQGSASNPVNGSSYAGGDFFTKAIAVNVGSISNDTVSAIVTAANQAYKVGDVSGENAFFFGQDPQGNTMVWFWRGDKTHAGTILASDITGGMELVGIHASSLTSANFHY